MPVSKLAIQALLFPLQNRVFQTEIARSYSLLVVVDAAFSDQRRRHLLIAESAVFEVNNQLICGVEFSRYGALLGKGLSVCAGAIARIG